MSALNALGFEPAPADDETTAEPTEPAAEPTEPAAEPTEPAAEPTEPVVEPEPVVPPGADNPDAVKALIKAERDAARKANAAARDLERQLKERDESAKPLEERLSAADDRAQRAELKALRLEVALENGLSLTLAPRLSGSTKEELVADATTLKSEMGIAPKPGMDGGYKADPPKPKDPSRAHNDFIASILGKTQQG